jgi:hypothetical protein
MRLLDYESEEILLAKGIPTPTGFLKGFCCSVNESGKLIRGCQIEKSIKS